MVNRGLEYQRSKLNPLHWLYYVAKWGMMEERLSDGANKRGPTTYTSKTIEFDSTHQNKKKGK